MSVPKVFMSYSWSSQDHEQWVIELASNLVESGVEVVLDKWDLREGQDKFAFMERMLTDPAIGKVLIVCDRGYVEKADARRGGVGTESQIISAEVYSKVDQSKFVPIVSELGEDGAPILPAYLRGRIFIDMSSQADRYENFEQLLRWIYDRPLHQRPQLGKPPAYIFETVGPQLGTTARFRAAVDAVRLAKPTAVAAVEDYFDTFATNLEVLRVVRSPETEYDDAVVASIDGFKTYRDEAIDVVALIARYRSDLEMYEVIHRWLERLLTHKYPPEAVTSWRNDDFDNFKFMLNEIFLYTTAALLKARRYLQTGWLLGNTYFVPSAISRRDGGRLDIFDEFQDYVHSLDETRKERLKLRRLSIVSDMLRDRATRKDLQFDDLMQAEFVLILYSILHSPHRVWSPRLSSLRPEHAMPTASRRVTHVPGLFCYPCRRLILRAIRASDLPSRVRAS
jgi:SEFIR domain